MTRLYYVCNCVHCDQCWLTIQRRLDLDCLYLHCGECEWGWHHPLDAGESARGFLTLLLDFESSSPSLADIEASGWGPFVIGFIEA